MIPKSEIPVYYIVRLCFYSSIPEKRIEPVGMSLYADLSIW
jgi:hypothetical protein